jgi:abequosyltransferase
MLLTIAIPTFNRAALLETNLFYLLSQYQNNFNIIVQDNASTDNTENIIDKYIHLGLPIEYERNSKNFGWTKNFELCFQKCQTKYIMVIGDDDYIVNGGIKLILDNLEHSNPDLLFLNGFATKKKVNSHLSSKKESTINKEEFLLKTILQFRLISSHVINYEYVKRVKSFDGNFAHLHPVLIGLRDGKKFIYLKEKIVACYPNNSKFDLESNFSDTYVNEFFTLFRSYLKNVISKKYHTEIEEKMLKQYYPKLILKSRLGMIKNDKNIKYNFDTIFKKNNFYQKNSHLYYNNTLISNIFLTFKAIQSMNR